MVVYLQAYLTSLEVQLLSCPSLLCLHATDRLIFAIKGISDIASEIDKSDKFVIIHRISTDNKLNNCKVRGKFCQL